MPAIEHEARRLMQSRHREVDEGAHALLPLLSNGTGIYLYYGSRAAQAERDRITLSGIFGRFVPQAIVNAMIAGRGALAPVEREATVLFADIAGFTAMTERAGAVRTVEILNAYFDEVTRIIGTRNGIVTQFQGDALLATFNVPVEDARHAGNAFEAAREILACVAKREFVGERSRCASASIRARSSPATWAAAGARATQSMGTQ